MTINHPFEHFHGVCDCCGETFRDNEGDWIVALRRDSCDIVGWRCDLCDVTFFATHQSDWSPEERADADRIWASLGKEVAA